MTTDLYATIGLDRYASPQDIKKAYRRLTKLFHPDVAPGHQAEWEALQLAYDILFDPLRRAKYDATGSIDPSQPDNTISDLMQSLTAIMDAVLSSIRGNGKDPLAHDLIKSMIQCAEQSRKNCQEVVTQNQTTVEQLTELAARFEVEDEDAPNYLRKILEARLNGAVQKLEEIRRQHETLRAVHLYLQGCKFRKIEPKILPGVHISTAPSFMMF